MKGSEKTWHTRLTGTISLKLSSSSRRSFAYGGSCVILLGSTSIWMPFFLNAEREGTIFFTRCSRKWRNLRGRPPFLSCSRSSSGPLHYPIHIPQSPLICNPRLKINPLRLHGWLILVSQLFSARRRGFIRPRSLRGQVAVSFHRSWHLTTIWGLTKLTMSSNKKKKVKLDIYSSILSPCFSCRFTASSSSTGIPQVTPYLINAEAEVTIFRKQFNFVKKLTTLLYRRSDIS